MLREVGPSALISNLIGTEGAKHYESRESFLREQERSLDGFIDQTRLFIQDETRGYREKRDQLEAEFVAKKSLLDQEHRDREGLLAEEENQLKERKKILDDRDNTHARRATYEAIRTKLTERSQTFVLTSGTRNLRWWPWASTLVFLACLMFGIYQFSQTGTTGSTTVQVLMISRQILLTAAAGAVFTFLIRMQQRWFQRHADEEFRLKRLDLDIDRATWLVELALEWKHAKEEEMPKELVDRLSHNLFVDIGERESDIHPLETAISSLLGGSGKMTVKSAGVELGIDKSAEAKPGK